MLAHRHWTRRFIILALLLIVLAGLAVFAIDPLQHYRKAAFYRPLWGNERYYNPGFVKHYDYNCIIIGSSMVQNFIPSEVGRTLSAKVLLASMSGATPYEENVLVRTALGTGKVRTVIWGLDLSPFGRGTRQLAYGPGRFPFYLYDDNPFNDYHYLLNIDVLLNDCRNALIYNLPGHARSRLQNLDSAHFTKISGGFAREAAVASWQKRRLEYRGRAANRSSDLDSMKNCFDSNVVPLLERNPEVKFLFFYPPYSILNWIDSDVFGLETYMDFKRYIFERTRRFLNVKLFDFQDVSAITHDLDKYRDWNHYSTDVNRFIIDAVSKNQCLVTDDNIDEKISRLESQVRSFTDSLAAAERADSTSVKRHSGDGRTGRQDGEDLEP